MFLVTSNEVASLPAPRNAQSTLSRRLSPGDSKRPPAGESRHPLHPWYENVPPNQPRCRLSTGETCRIVDRRSMAESENVAAGACPPLGSGWGVAESAVPIRCTKPQLRLFIPWCAGASRHERLVRKCAYAAFERAVEPLHSAFSSFPRRRESRGGVWVANDAHATPPISATVFIPSCAGTSRHGRLVRK